MIKIILSSLASKENKWLLGPGIFSAKLKFLWFSTWQKYFVKNNSGKQITLAPFLTIVGYMVVLVGVLKRAKKIVPSEPVSSKENS